MADDARPKIAKVRKRAPKACLSCRARKVRCDVSQRGRPCMNCYLDSETCVVTGRAARLRKSQKAAAAATAAVTATAPAEQVHNHNDNHNHNHNQDRHAHRHTHTHGRHSPPLSNISEAESPVLPASVIAAARDSQIIEPPQSEARQATLPASFQDGPSSHVPPPIQPAPQPQSSQQSSQQQQPGQQNDNHNHNRHANHGHGHHSIHGQNHYSSRFNSSNSYHNDNANFNSFGGMDPNIMNMNMNMNMNTNMNPGRNSWTPDQGLSLTADITYSYYPFLCISNVSGILPQDVNYLELQGCLRVPTRSALDEFVQQFFLHVHPLLPLFHEGDFWDLYCQQASGVGGSGEIPCGRMSLFVLQAMLFATCSYVSRNSIRALGFLTVRQARTAFYRRAKLLFDFETESSPAAIAQGSLLLSYWSPSTSPGIKAPNTGWLCTAIHYAKIAEAHHYARMGDSATTAADVCRAKALKRLWWCCIIRDRLMSLGVRRPLQVTRVNFDLDTNPPLCRADLADEIERSRVYNPGTKACLIELTLQLAKMCVVITDMLTVVFPQDDSPGWARQRADHDAGRVRQCKLEMRQWHNDVSSQFPMFSSGNAQSKNNSSSSSSSNNSGKPREFCHDSIILYTNLMHMYYHSARVALCHHEALHVAVANAVAATQAPDTQGGTKRSVVYENRYELHDAASGVIESLKELIQRRLARWLPVSAVACSALPLFLHILDVKLSTSAAAAAAASTPASVLTTRDDGAPSTADLPQTSASSSSTNPPSALKRHRLSVLIEAMKTYQPQYDGVDWVSETIRHLVNLAQLDGPTGTASNASEVPSSPSTSTSTSDWTDILTTNPLWYLRLALTMDLALSKNRMPEERDFPVSLRGMFASSGFIPVRRLGYKGGDSYPLGPSVGLHPGGPVHGSVNIFSGCGGGDTRGRQDADSTTVPLARMNDALGGHPTCAADTDGGIKDMAAVHTTAPVATSGPAMSVDVSLNDGFGHTFPTDAFLGPHPFAMSMGMGLGMVDMDGMNLDLDDVDDVDATDTTDKMFSVPLMTPGVVTQLTSSDGGDDSPGSGNAPSTAAEDSPHNNTAPNILSEHDRSMLDAYNFDDDDDDDDGEESKTRHVSVSKTAPRSRGEWMETAWDHDGGELREADRDTARALLDAMVET